VSNVERVAAPPAKPVLVFDGECAFCRRWVARWQRATGERVEYIPYQDARVADRFPDLPRERFERAVQWIEPDGAVYEAAEAVFRCLAILPASRWMLALYRHLPGFAPVSEWSYGFVARHRGIFSTLTRLSVGSHTEPPAAFLTRWLFLRFLGVIYLIAFVSLWTQMDGLVGRNGILPAHETMRNVGEYAQREGLGLDRFRQFPTLCWLGASDAVLHAQCAAGVVVSIALIAGVAPVAALVLLWVLYLSLATVCQIFLGYQWDILLLETGFLAIFVAPWQLLPRPSREAPPSPVAIWLLRLLLFKLMFCSGVVKLASKDPNWVNLNALKYHYETQPLPTWIGWYAHQLPDFLHELSCAAMFGIELALPFFVLLPRRLRLFAFWPFLGLQLLIAATGNYCFFNLLTVLLCLSLVDDTALRRVGGKWTARLAPVFGAKPGNARWPAWVLAPVTVGVILLTLVPVTSSFRAGRLLPESWVRVYSWFAPLRTVNGYGLFAVMTTSRPEIVIEGSHDGVTWQGYEFKHKAGDLKRAPGFVAPHQPRLDWQMWFAALGNYQGNPWFLRFCERLLRGSPEVLALLEHNPFPDAPPRYLRALVYDYRFTDFATRRRDGTWWRRELKGAYCPQLSLREQ
jgi:predicted DCC family thiol-disulfide oxidoreductase YuxK